MGAFHMGLEAFEELVRHLARETVDQAGAQLRDLAADLGLHVVMQVRAAALGIAQRHLRRALGEARDAALALARDGVAFPGTTSDRVTAPLKVALTGPTFCLTTASKPSSGVPVSSSQPGMQALSTSASLSAAQTVARSAASVRVACISMGSVLPVACAQA
jgi:hypothetical protein